MSCVVCSTDQPAIYVEQRAAAQQPVQRHRHRPRIGRRGPGHVVGLVNVDARLRNFHLERQGSFAYTNPEFAAALGLLESGLVQPAVARRSFSLAESGDVFGALLAGRSDGFLKAIIRPG